jgi:hypothetical protein
MSKLPNCSKAMVAINKIEGYLLNLDHPEGRSKAIFFRKFGYSSLNTYEFIQALLDLACAGRVVKIEDKLPFGTRFTIEGNLKTPDGRNPKIRIGWFFDIHDNEKVPRLITVFPS